MADGREEKDREKMDRRKGRSEEKQMKRTKERKVRGSGKGIFLKLCMV